MVVRGDKMIISKKKYNFIMSYVWNIAQQEGWEMGIKYMQAANRGVILGTSDYKDAVEEAERIIKGEK